MRLARYHPPQAAPMIATTTSVASSTGDTRGFGLIIVTVLGRAVVGGRSVCVTGICEVPAVAGMFPVGSGTCVNVRGGDAGLATPDIVDGVENVESDSRLKARSRADWNRTSRSFSRHRRTRRSSGGGTFGFS